MRVEPVPAYERVGDRWGEAAAGDGDLSAAAPAEVDGGRWKAVKIDRPLVIFNIIVVGFLFVPSTSLRGRRTLLDYSSFFCKSVLRLGGGALGSNSVSGAGGWPW